MKKNKADNPKSIPSQKEITDAMQNCFGRTNKYPTITAGSLKKVVENIPDEYNDSEVAFAFVIKTNGDKNFTLGTVSIKLIAINPDQTKVLFCDDAAAEEFFKTNATVTYANEKGLTDENEMDKG